MNDDDDDDFDQFDLGNVTIMQKIGVAAVVLAAVAGSRGKISPSVAFRIIKLGGSAALTAGQLSLLQQGGHAPNENAAKSARTLPLRGDSMGAPPFGVNVAGLGVTRPRLISGAAPGRTTSPIFYAGYPVVRGVLQAAYLAGAPTPGAAGVALARVSSAGSGAPTYNVPPGQEGGDRVFAVGGGAMGSFAPGMVEPINDAGIRNGDAQKGIGKELIHERADP